MYQPNSYFITNDIGSFIAYELKSLMNKCRIFLSINNGNHCVTTGYYKLPLEIKFYKGT